MILPRLLIPGLPALVRYLWTGFVSKVPSTSRLQMQTPSISKEEIVTKIQLVITSEATPAVKHNRLLGVNWMSPAAAARKATLLCQMVND